MRRSGFTLIELLVVIAIIAILAAILFPVFMKARQAAKQAMCLVHVRELGAAVLNYSADYRDTFPMFASFENGVLNWWDGRWDRIIFPYVKNQKIYQCPIQTRDKSASSFAVNMNLVWNPYDLTHSTAPVAANGAMVKRPSKVVMLFDAQTEAWQRKIGAGNSEFSFFVAGASSGEYRTGMRHGDGDNFCFADGHAKWYELRSMKDAGMSPIYDWKGISFRTDY